MIIVIIGNYGMADVGVSAGWLRASVSMVGRVVPGLGEVGVSCGAVAWILHVVAGHVDDGLPRVEYKGGGFCVAKA